MNLRIECSFASETKNDESIAVNGVCLTVVGQDERHFRAQVVEETLRKTNLGDLRKGDRVNLEFDIFGKYIARYMELRFSRDPDG